MAKYVRNEVSSGYTSNEINDELEKIQLAIDDQLDRQDGANNQMDVNLDMNSKRILNLLDASDLSEPVPLRQMLGLIDAITGGDLSGLTAAMLFLTDGRSIEQAINEIENRLDNIENTLIDQKINARFQIVSDELKIDINGDGDFDS